MTTDKPGAKLARIVRAIFPDATDIQVSQLRHDLYAIAGVDAFRMDGLIPAIQCGTIELSEIKLDTLPAGHHLVVSECGTVRRETFKAEEQ